MNVRIESEDIKSVHIMFEKTEGAEWIYHFFLAKKWSQEIKNLEPQKCDDVKWFDINDLPKNIIPFVEHALSKIYKEKSNYCECQRN